MTTFRLAAAAVALAAAMALTACTAKIGEESFLRPVAAGGLSQDALTGASSVYTVSRRDVRASDGTALHAAYLTQPNATATVLYFGGNGYTVGTFGAKTAEIFAPLGVNLMIVDHRGYGLSQGKPTAETIHGDGIAAFDHLARMPNVDASRIIVHGQSLGSFIAGHVAAHRPAAGVALESSVTTTEEWIKLRVGNKPIKVQVAETLKELGNARYMARIDEPLLLLVGADDKITPPQLSEGLYRASPLPQPRKALAIIAGAAHNDVMLQPSAIHAYRDFLARLQSVR